MIGNVTASEVTIKLGLPIIQELEIIGNPLKRLLNDQGATVVLQMS